MAFSISVALECALLTLFMCFSHGSASSQLAQMWIRWCAGCESQRNCTCGSQDCCVCTCDCLEYATGVIIGLVGLQLVTLIIVCVETCYICAKKKKKNAKPNKEEDEVKNDLHNVIGDSVAGENDVRSRADSNSNVQEMKVTAKSPRDQKSQNEVALYSECSRPRSCTAPIVETTLYAYACVKTGKKAEECISVECSSRVEKTGGKEGSVAEKKAEPKSENSAYPCASLDRPARNPPIAPINEDESEHMYSKLDTGSQAPQPKQMTDNCFYYNEKLSTNPTVTSFQLSTNGITYDTKQLESPRASTVAKTFSYGSLPIEEQLYDMARPKNY